MQSTITLGPFPRGFHIITSAIDSWLNDRCDGGDGLCHLFLKHTSASLTVNENADPDVRKDFESHFNQMVPEHAPYYVHTLEGPDDMPAHLKSSILGTGLLLPVSDGRLNLGTWQGVYLCEHRNRAGKRNLVLTFLGDKSLTRAGK